MPVPGDAAPDGAAPAGEVTRFLASSVGRSCGQSAAILASSVAASKAGGLDGLFEGGGGGHLEIEVDEL